MYPFTYLQGYDVLTTLYCERCFIIHDRAIALWHQWSFETTIDNLFE